MTLVVACLVDRALVLGAEAAQLLLDGGQLALACLRHAAFFGAAVITSLSGAAPPRVALSNNSARRKSGGLP
jgi:hypothetical protein